MLTKTEFLLKAGRIEKATRHSAAFDLFYDGPAAMTIGDVPTAVPTGVYTEFAPEFVCIIKEKSGLALKGLEVKAGVIDSDYRDEWKVICRCPSKGLFRIEPGQKIAQFLIVRLPYLLPEAAEGAQVIIKSDARSGGFGSTGS